jgi:hypothetical protein
MSDREKPCRCERCDRGDGPTVDLRLVKMRSPGKATVYEPAKWVCKYCRYERRGSWMHAL